MRERFGNILRCFTAAIADAALSSLLIVLMLTLYDVPRTVHLGIGVWALVLLIQALLNEFLSERSPSLLIYIGINAALLLIGRQYVLRYTTFVPGSSGFPLLLGLLVLASGAHSAYAAQKLPGSDFFVRMTDVLIASTVSYLSIAFALGEAFHLPVLAFVLAAFALLLLTTASLRAGGESDSVIRGTGIGGWLVLGALLIFCLLFTAALLSLGSDHVNSLVDAIKVVWAMITQAGQTMLYLFTRFLALFIRPRHLQQQIVHHDSPAVSDIEMTAMRSAPEWIVSLIMVLMGVLILAAIIAILWALHSMKFSRSRTRRRRRRVTRKSHFLSALRALLCRIADRIFFEISYLFGRQTPQGLLVLTQRTGLLHRLPRRRSESGGAYLRRLHGLLTAQGVSSTLDVLAGDLDALFYGGQSCSLTRAQYEAYREQIRQIRPLPTKEKPDPNG